MGPPAFRARVVALMSMLAVVGCGGGGGSVPPAPPPPTLPVPEVGPIAVADPGSALPECWQRGAFMQIFVRSYQDSDGDGMGDLHGLISRLDYLRELGVSGLWLMPITRSQDGDHGYAVTDYRDIELDYGKLADLDELVNQAHARGIGVIIDHVISHSAAQRPLFVNAANSPQNRWRGWYVWKSPTPAGWSIYGNNPWRITANGAYFAPFWEQMPDFNLLKARWSNPTRTRCASG